MFCPSLKPPFVEGMAQLERLVRRTTSCAQVAAARPLPRRSRWRKSNLSNSLSSRWKTRQMVNLMWNFQVYVEQELWGIVIYSGQLDFWWFLMISDDFWWFLMISDDFWWFLGTFSSEIIRHWTHFVADRLASAATVAWSSQSPSAPPGAFVWSSWNGWNGGVAWDINDT